MVRWQTAEGKWTHEADDRTFTFKPGAEGWQSGLGVVTVPPDAGKIVVLLDIRGQRTD